ncbi:MAG TPA: response regulator transcription factor [Thermoleophilaceae bacterium]|nr:response regulator transcription factor [Thermoleophilaceae bacterium]
MKKMVIVADSSFVIETIRLALRSAAGLNVMGKVDGRGTVRRPIAECQPDIVLVDEMQSSEHALERIRECREEAPSSVILLLTMRMEDEWVAEAIAAGCDACLSKSAHLPSLGTLIREIVARNIVTALPPTLAEGNLALSGGEDLTAREREILALVSDGLTNARIGRELWVTEQTVKFHLSNIYRKLGVSNRTEASRYAYTHGLLRRAAPRVAATADELASVSELRPVTTAGAA